MNKHFYETGSTQPPKSRAWLVLFLMLLIFVGGIITAMGILNIRFLSTLSADREDSVPLTFTRVESTYTDTRPQAAESHQKAGLGIEAETVSPFIRAYYRLPRGVYIPRVPTGSNAAAAGILPGDILLSLNKQRITDTDTLKALLRHYNPGDVVAITLYRDGLELSVNLTLERE